MRSGQFELIKWEMRRLIKSPIFSVLIVTLVVSCLVLPLVRSLPLANDEQLKQDINIMEANPDMDLSNNFERTRFISQEGVSQFNETRSIRSYYSQGIPDRCYFTELELNRHKFSDVESIKAELEKFPGNSRLACQLKMMTNIGQPELHFMNFAKNYLELGDIEMLFVYFLIILLVSDLFMKEYKSGSYKVIDTSEIGYKAMRRVKLMAALMIAVLIIIIIDLVPLIIYCLFSNGVGFFCKLNSYSTFAYTPYNITVFQYSLFRMIIHIIGLVLVVEVTSLISLKSGNTQLSIFGTVFLIVGPALLRSLIGNNVVTNFSLWSLLNTKILFAEFNGFVISGKLVSLPVLVCALSLLLTAGLYLGIIKIKPENV